MSLGPNKEQEKVIQSKGGILLEAGAGSGKTFVIIEHVFKLLDKFIHENKGQVKFDEKFESFCSSLVIMTFTRKATNEIRTRLKAKFKLIKDDFPEFEIEGAFQAINVSTIHGLCSKLIKKGYVRNIPTNFTILEEFELRKKVKGLLYQGLIHHKDEIGIHLFNTLVTQKEELIDSFVDIFGSPERRLVWCKSIKQSKGREEFSQYFLEEVFSYFGVKVKWTFSFNSLDNFKKNKWYEFLVKYNDLLNNLSKDEKGLRTLVEFCHLNKGVRSPNKKYDLLEVEEVIGSYKDLRSFMSKHSDSILGYLDFFDTLVKEKDGSFKKLFQFIEDNYLKTPGISYADLEYYVYLDLIQKDKKDPLFKDFSYFIVDEFQDTSKIQFNILKLLVQGKFKKIFCVGDIKQAIYGFRGGDIDVFKEGINLIPKYLTLKNNYRSNKNIVLFNNHFFNNLFQDKEFKGSNKTETILFNSQEAQKEDEGIVKILDWDLFTDNPKEGSFSVGEWDYYENFLLFEGLLKIYREKKDENICILFRSLKASRPMIRILMENNIPFVSQTKIPFQEDPVIGIFTILVHSFLEYRFLLKGGNPNANFVSTTELLIQSYFRVLELPEVEIKKNLYQFYSGVSSIGWEYSFEVFLFSIGVSIPFEGEGRSFIEKICKNSLNSPDQIFEYLNEGSSKTYSYDFEFGDGDKRINIMTSHSSKGLEFDHVFLGGAHCNGRTIPNRSILGLYPGSFKWKKDFTQSKLLSGPNLILENLWERAKELSEGKRLLYVTCSRAKKGLYWVNIKINGVDSSKGKNNWINSLRNYISHDELDFPLSIERNKMELNTLRMNYGNDEIKVPLFHQDNFGIDFAERRLNNQLGIIPELSVTKLARICECPRKFFFKDICQLTDDLKDYENSDLFLNWDAGEVGNKGISSAERGTGIHNLISEYIREDNFKKEIFLNKEDQDAFHFAAKLLEKYKGNYEFISEKQIKFPIFGQMVSGTPDLVLIPKLNNDSVIIIDFKTGLMDSTSKKSYQFQLYCYLIGVTLHYDISLKNNFSLDLFYLDKKEVVSEEVNFEEAMSFLNTFQSYLSNFDTPNEDHCPQCPYKVVCYT